MVNVKSKKCTHEGCKRIPFYNYEGKTTAFFCLVHKKDGMFNVNSKKCTHEGCKTLPIYNFENETKALYCSVHKEDGMVDVKNQRTDAGKKNKTIGNGVVIANKL